MTCPLGYQLRVFTTVHSGVAVTSISLSATSVCRRIPPEQTKAVKKVIMEEWKSMGRMTWVLSLLLVIDRRQVKPHYRCCYRVNDSDVVVVFCENPALPPSLTFWITSVKSNGDGAYNIFRDESERKRGRVGFSMLVRCCLPTSTRNITSKEKVW